MLGKKSRKQAAKDPVVASNHEDWIIEYMVMGQSRTLLKPAKIAANWIWVPQNYSNL